RGVASVRGLPIREQLVASGAKVWIGDLDSGAGDAAGKELGASSVPADVSDPAPVGSALQKTLRIISAIDIFINNAGISGPNAKLWEYPVEDWKELFTR